MASLPVKNGSFRGMLNILGSSGKISVASTDASTDTDETGLIGNVTVTGDLAGLEVATGDLIADVQVSGALQCLTLSHGANLIGEVQAMSIASVSASAEKGVGGNLAHGSSLTATKSIGTVALSGGTIDGQITCANGRITSVKVTDGNIAGRLVGAGVDSVTTSRSRGVVTGGDITARIESTKGIGTVSAAGDITEAQIQAALGVTKVSAAGAIDGAIISAGYTVGDDGIPATDDDAVVNDGKGNIGSVTSGTGDISARIQANRNINQITSAGQLNSGTLEHSGFITAGGRITTIRTVGNVGVGAGSTGHTSAQTGVSSIWAAGGIGSLTIHSPKTVVDGRLLADVFAPSLTTLQTDGLAGGGVDFYDMTNDDVLVPAHVTYDTNKNLA